MEDRNQKTQELELEQLEKASGGVGATGTFKCPGCKAEFTQISSYINHMKICPKAPKEANPTVLA